ncbi:Deuterosome protein 1 [Lonchura striata]|uniref:Deuterosome protein 1 n=1 Tax=Lonchura striata TaxID=40157 RepID=A0A218V569_9PASE|nr:Deuterosome protein 1 [Lonchura striata domestica]
MKKKSFYVFRASPCEAELQELVHQIGIMVNRKQVEWERKMRALEAKMDIQDQELASAQSKLDQKGQEVGLLQQELENLQKTKNEMAQSYETQLQALKSQVRKMSVSLFCDCSIKNLHMPNCIDFSKLIHSYEKLQSHQLKPKNLQSRENCEENLETSSNPRNLYVKLEKQTQNYQHQICNKKQSQEELITYTQPKSENYENDDSIIEKLKAIVNEIARNKNKLVEENMKLHEDLKMYQNQCQNMEADISEMRNELQSRDGLWRRIQLECQKLYTELLKIKEYKDMREIQIKHQSSPVYLTEQLETKNGELLIFAESREHQEEELNKIRNHVYREERSHCSEQERMKTEISDLTEELHQKEITIATIMEKASLLERQLKMELETKHKLLTKQQLLEFHYQAIKSENTHLKEMVENQECESCMIFFLLDPSKIKIHGKWNVNSLLCSLLVDATETAVLLCMTKAISLVQKVIALYLLIHFTEAMKRKQIIKLHYHQWGVLWAFLGHFLQWAEQAAFRALLTMQKKSNY